MTWHGLELFVLVSTRCCTLVHEDMHESAAMLMQVDPSVTFDQVGGLDGYIDKLKEMIFLPLVYPELFERFHVNPPRGVLLYGPPGKSRCVVCSLFSFHIGGGEAVRKCSAMSFAVTQLAPWRLMHLSQAFPRAGCRHRQDAGREGAGGAGVPRGAQGDLLHAQGRGHPVQVGRRGRAGAAAAVRRGGAPPAVHHLLRRAGRPGPGALVLLCPGGQMRFALRNRPKALMLLYQGADAL
jgi:hypothetical protein